MKAFLILSVFLAYPTYARDFSAPKVPTTVQAISDPAKGLITYYIGTEGEWTIPNCTNVKMVVFDSKLPGAKEIYATVLLSKIRKKPIRFGGQCLGDGRFRADAFIAN